MARTLLAVLALLAILAAPLRAQDTAPTPARIGALAAAAYLDRADFMTYSVGEVHAVHYADVASAYGVMRLAEAMGDEALFARAAARHRKLIAAAMPNTANHVDANVYGLWPLELYRRAGDKADLARGLAMADGQWARIGPDGLTAQARYWIDDIWMIGALQNAAWRATGEAKYLDRSALVARRYIERLQQPDGLFHHGPDAPFAWGRGNGWVAAGLAEVLSELPPSHPDYPAIAEGYRRMMAALLRHQTEDGMWRQLIDHPGSWKETSGTAMFGYALAVGVRRGILTDSAYAQAYRKAWTALARYVDAKGNLSQVCVGTGQSRDAAITSLAPPSPATSMAKPRCYGSRLNWPWRMQRNEYAVPGIPCPPNSTDSLSRSSDFDNELLELALTTMSERKWNRKVVHRCPQIGMAELRRFNPRYPQGTYRAAPLRQDSSRSKPIRRQRAAMWYGGGEKPGRGYKLPGSAIIW